jgi:O-antigen/teichoic acid export membrane protein
VTPWIALGVGFQGLYLVGSIGLVISKRTKRYPVATGTAALVSLAANFALIPRFGILGAAWANAVSYATLAAVTVGFSWQVYPIPYEWARLLRITVAGGLSYLVGARFVPTVANPFVEIVLTGAAVVATYAAVLWSTGFFHAGELKMLQDLRARTLSRRSVRRPEDPTQVEMAGEIVATAPEPPVDEDPDDGRDSVVEISPDSRSPRR